MQTENTNELAAALAKAQGAMEAAKFDKVNPHFKNKYASLAAVVDAIRKPLADNALSYTQTTAIRDGGFVLVTTLRHASGQWVASEYPLPVDVKPQELGSALTYARRYSLSAIACIAADEDDDAEGARKDGQTNSKPPVKPAAVEPPVHPETGEAGPHLIVEDNDMRWGAKFVAAIKTTKSPGEINAWIDACKERLDALATDAPKIHDRIITNIEVEADRLKRTAA